ncbi:hypothetical protein ABBQ32_013003 [Trebouxia sp. C0010 RCD-2024]
MPSGRLKSPIPLDSASDAEDAHPVDAVIQAAISRQQSPGPGVGFSGRAGKRKRAGSPLPEPVLRHASSDLGSLDSGDNTAKQDPTSPSASKSIPAAGVAPIGVTVVEEGAQTRNAEVQRLLRGGRYFDLNTEELGPVCFRCGERGHTQYSCNNQRSKPVACALCAQFGHNKSQCPSLLCYKCKKRGHIARDCPNLGQVHNEGRKVCLRCGKGKCAAAGEEDYHRAEGACTEDYYEADLALVRCYTCNRMGHLCCKGAPQDPPDPSCHNCGEAGHLAVDCSSFKPPQVAMERQFDNRRPRPSGPSESDSWSHDRWASRGGSAGGHDRWFSGNTYGAYNGASMAVGNGYASRVNALHERTQGRDQYTTPYEQTASRVAGSRYYPGSEKIHGPQHDRYGSYRDREPQYAYGGARSEPPGRWRR